MITIFNSTNLPFLEASLVTIGNFDGVHIGHTTLIKSCVNQAKELNLPSVLITFDPHPSELFADKPALPIIGLFERIKRIEELGIDYCIVLAFDREFAAQRSEVFIKNFLIAKLSCQTLFTGYNFRMGKDKLGQEDLAKVLEKYDCTLTIQEEVAYTDKENKYLKVSSTAIRNSLVEGKIEMTNALLGRLHCVQGVVEHGAKRGSSLLGFPTANMDTGNLLLPKPGVYATSAFLPNIEPNKEYKAISNIGYNPTFAGDKLLIESYLLDFNQDIYHQNLQICFHTRIRDEKKFNNIDELIKQLKADEQFRIEL